jgi:ribonuclease R
VHVTALGNDYFHFDPVRHCLTGEHSKRIFRLGDQVNVKVVRVNLDDRKIDFELSEKLQRKTGKTGKKSRRKDKGKGQHKRKKTSLRRKSR